MSDAVLIKLRQALGMMKLAQHNAQWWALGISTSYPAEKLSALLS
jgi:hypothetical protein